jgi:cytoskeletal protein CcmA (bactofilin family)
MGKGEERESQKISSGEVVMFAKDPEKMESFLGGNSNFKGELNVKGTIRVDGLVEGRLDADCVILSERAVVKGEIQGRKLIIGGKVEGILRAKESVEIKSKGKILGDIFTQKLTVMEGAEYNGKIEMKGPETKVIDMKLRGQEA